jgi:putative inorganic carbon (HCO3(-)) transporter
VVGRLTWLQTPVAVLTGVFCLAVASAVLSLETGSPLSLAPIGVLVVPAVAYLALTVDPAVTLTLGVFLTPFAGNWQQLGIPGALAPDRLLIASTIVIVVLRAVTGRGPPLPRPRPVHYVLALAVLWVVGSALASHTLLQRAPLLKIVEAYGVFPFLIFYLAPVIYTTPRRRQMLLRALVVLGAYLGLTVMFEMAGPHALVWPKYILSPTYGIHQGRGRGPFADAVANGFGLYVCALASCIAVAQWSGRARLAAGLVGALCLIGTFLTLERSVWIGVAVGTVVTLLAFGRLRRFSVPVIVGAATALLLVFILVPGLSAKVQSRASDQGPVWDRENLSVAALNMVSARPLFGFGWARFPQASAPYFQQSQNYPLTATGIDIHNYFLSYATELGLLGLLIWLIGLAMGAFGALTTRAPPELEPWRMAFLGLAVCFVIVANSVPPTVFQNEAFWLWAGIIWSARDYSQTRIRRVSWCEPRPRQAGSPS